MGGLLASSMLNKGFRAYFLPISTIICRKVREKFNLKFLGLSISTNSTMGGLLPHFWKASLSTSRANFWPVFPLKVSKRKKRNTFDRFFVENKWKYEKNWKLFIRFRWNLAKSCRIWFVIFWSKPVCHEKSRYQDNQLNPLENNRIKKTKGFLA